MNDALKLLIFFIVFTLLFSIIKKYLTVKLERELVKLIMSRDYEKFDELINSKKVKYLIQPFNIDFMKLNSALMKDNKKEVDEMFDYFDNVRPNKKQQEAVFSRGFYYYLSREKYDKVEKYYNLLKNLKDENSMYEFDRAYDTYAKKGFKYLENTLEELKAAPDYVKPALEGLISTMYENKKDKKMAKEYADKVLKHVEDKKAENKIN